MAEEIFLQNWIFTRFAFPFLLIFFIFFAVLEKTEVLGKNKQLNALISFIVAFIFISVAYPTEIANNLILFLTIAIVVIFAALLLWGFVMGNNDSLNIFDKAGPGLKWIIGIVIIIAVGIATIWAMGPQGGIIDFLFGQSWSKTVWTNIIFVVLIAIALAVTIKGSK